MHFQKKQGSKGQWSVSLLESTPAMKGSSIKEGKIEEGGVVVN